MKIFFLHGLGLLILSVNALAADEGGRTKRRTEVAIRENAFWINGRPTYEGRFWQGRKVEGLLFNARMVQGIFDDLNPATRTKWAYPDTGRWDPERNTREFLAALPIWRRHGLLAFTLNLQGGSPEGYSQEQPWHNSSFTETGALRPEYMKRLKNILDKADELGMAVILGIFYFGQDRRLEHEAAVERGLDNAVTWVLDRGYRHVLLEVNNECNIRYHHAILQPQRVHELIERTKRHTRDGRRLLVSTSYGGGTIPGANVVKAADFLLLHGNGVTDPDRIAAMVRQTRAVPGYRPMPILFNEDDHYAFDQPKNNLQAALEEYASWGYFDYRRPGEAFDEGFQSVPVNWQIASARKRAFFAKLQEITGSKPTQGTPPSRPTFANSPDLLPGSVAPGAGRNPENVKHVKVYHEAGRFGGWPANHGIWCWGNEILVGFSAGYYKDLGPTRHAIDREKPEEHFLARSRDGGETWSIENPGTQGVLIGTAGMRHGILPPGIREPEPVDCPGNINFTNPEFAMTCRMAGNNTGVSRFYYSYDRGRTWKGPFKLPLFGQPGIAARTDYIVNGRRDCMIFLTASKTNNREGRVLGARTRDGGKTWSFLAFIGPEPKGYSIMPSTVRLAPLGLLTTIRCYSEADQTRKSWIESWVSSDDGKSWSFLNEPVPDTGEGNPPHLIKLADGRLCLTYGVRADPFRIGAKLSGDDGRTWSREIVLRNDGGNRDMGYPRSVQRPDGKLVTVYYFWDKKTGPERYIAASIWDSKQ